jgi:hypothetical protein
VLPKQIQTNSEQEMLVANIRTENTVRKFDPVFTFDKQIKHFKETDKIKRLSLVQMCT